MKKIIATMAVMIALGGIARAESTVAEKIDEPGVYVETIKHPDTVRSFTMESLDNSIARLQSEKVQLQQQIDNLTVLKEKVEALKK